MRQIPIKPMKLSKEQAKLAFMMRKVQQAKNITEFGSYLHEAYALMDCNEEREKYQTERNKLEKQTPHMIADKLLDDVIDLLQYPKTLEKVINLKYQRQKEDLEDFVDDLDQLKEIVAHAAPYKQLQRIQQTLMQKSNQVKYLCVYEQTKEFIQERDNLSEEKIKKMDQQFYGLFLFNFAITIKSGAIIPKNSQGCFEIYHLYHDLREKVKEVEVSIPVLGSKGGKFSTDEVIYSELEKHVNGIIERADSPEEREELFAERDQLIANGQELLYQEAVWAGEQQNWPYFNFIRSNFLYYSNKFGLDENEGETPADEVKFLKQHYFPNQSQKKVRAINPQMMQQALQDFLNSGNTEQK